MKDGAIVNEEELQRARLFGVISRICWPDCTIDRTTRRGHLLIDNDKSERLDHAIHHLQRLLQKTLGGKPTDRI